MEKILKLLQNIYCQAAVQNGRFLIVPLQIKQMMRDSEIRHISIITATDVYHIEADGYMSGTILSKESMDDYRGEEYVYDNIRNENYVDRYYEKYGNRQGNNLLGNSILENTETNTFNDELDNFIEEHPERFADKRESYTDYKKRIETEASSNEGAFSMPDSTTHELIEQRDNGDITEDEFLSQMNAIWESKIETALKNAVGIETHSNRYYYDTSTIEFIELLGGYIDCENFIPVRFGIKLSNTGNSLYIMIDDEGIKKPRSSNRYLRHCLGAPTLARLMLVYPIFLKVSTINLLCR